MARPKIVYANAVNLRGLFAKKPIKCEWDKDTQEWFDESGNLGVSMLGELIRDGAIITFASTEKKQVETWIKGVRAAMKMRNIWSS